MRMAPDEVKEKLLPPANGSAIPVTQPAGFSFDLAGYGGRYARWY
jgi:hypothetical protein